MAALWKLDDLLLTLQFITRGSPACPDDHGSYSVRRHLKWPKAFFPKFDRPGSTHRVTQRFIWMQIVASACISLHLGDGRLVTGSL